MQSMNIHAGMTPEETKAKLEAAIAQWTSELAALEGPGGKVDVLADARQAVKAYTDQLRSDLANAGDEAGEGRVSEALESFLSKIESGLSVAEAEAEFRRLQNEQQTNQYAADFEAAMGGGSSGDSPSDAGASVGGGADATTAAVRPTGIALGPTYSAAAAQAAGQMGSGGSPQEKMTTSIYEMAKTLRELGLLSKDQAASNKQVAILYERFLAAMTYG
jgi:hypothetical protein